MLNITEKTEQLVRIPRTTEEVAGPAEFILESRLRNISISLAADLEKVYSDYIELNVDFSNVKDGEYIYRFGNEGGIAIVGTYIEDSKTILDSSVTIETHEDTTENYYYE